MLCWSLSALYCIEFVTFTWNVREAILCQRNLASRIFIKNSCTTFLCTVKVFRNLIFTVVFKMFVPVTIVVQFWQHFLFRFTSHFIRKIQVSSRSVRIEIIDWNYYHVRFWILEIQSDSELTVWDCISVHSFRCFENSCLFRCSCVTRVLMFINISNILIWNI